MTPVGTLVMIIQAVLSAPPSPRVVSRCLSGALSAVWILIHAAISGLDVIDDDAGRVAEV